MKNLTFYIPENKPVLQYAGIYLQNLGCTVSPTLLPETTHLLMSIPTTGSPVDLGNVPPDVTILGGNLDHTDLLGHHALDLLKDPDYVAKNAAITAHCAVRIAAERLPVTWNSLPVLVIGWGRIGKCLARLLRDLGAEITVAARKAEDRAMLGALGYYTADPNHLVPLLPRFRVVFNTAPHMIIFSGDTVHFRADCLKIDLASTPGIAGKDVIAARGLPGKMAPETTGHLIARTAVRLAMGGSL